MIYERKTTLAHYTKFLKQQQFKIRMKFSFNVSNDYYVPLGIFLNVAASCSIVIPAGILCCVKVIAIFVCSDIPEIQQYCQFYYSSIKIIVINFNVNYNKVQLRNRNFDLSNLTFVGPCIVIYFYSKTNQMLNISKLLYFGITLYMFQTVSPSTIRSLRLYIQHQVYVIQVLWLLASKQPQNLYGMMLYVQS